MLKIELTYFKPSGKFYTNGEFLTDFCSFHTIVDMVEGMQKSGLLPGLMKDCGKQYHILIETPDVGGDGPHGVSHLLMPLEIEEED